MAFDPTLPYNDLPILPPAVEIETRTVLKACIEARAALAELRMAGQLIPNQGVLVNAIPILEAQASSEIENIVTTTDRIFQYIGGDAGGADPSTQEAIRTRMAIERGVAALKERPLSVRLAADICRTIKDAELDLRDRSGTALLNDATGAIVYIPPEGVELLRALLANWERYLHEAEGVDPLIRMAVMHYQFEAIHPFIDGNGRTGRVLNLLFLIDKGLLDSPILHLSRYIIAHKDDYYRLLLEVTTKAAWEPWILYVLAAVRETSEWTTGKVKAIRALIEATAAAIREKAPKIYSRELAELIFVHPYARIGDLVEAGIVQRQSASDYLKALVEIGVLEEQKSGREKLFVNPALLNLLSDTVMRRA